MIVTRYFGKSEMNYRSTVVVISFVVAVICDLFVLTALASVKRTTSIDLRTDKKEAGRYFVIFSTRDGVVSKSSKRFPHAFVTFAAEDPEKSMSSETTVGFYKEKGKMFRGSIRDERREKGVPKPSNELRVQVNRDKYLQGLAVVEQKWSGNKTYLLTFSDCVSFVASISRAVGLQSPKSDEGALPETYIERLIDRNTE